MSEPDYTTEPRCSSEPLIREETDLKERAARLVSDPYGLSEPNTLERTA